jgi:hypothetical protein
MSENTTSGTATLLSGDDQHPIRVEVRSLDSLFPRLVEVTGDPDVMQFAFNEQKLKIEMFGTQFHVQTAGLNKETGALLILAGPFLKGLCRCASN